MGFVLIATGIAMYVSVAILLCVAVVGYVKNILALTECNFRAPYKAEVFRTVGVFTGPVGSVLGFMEIED